MFSFKDRTPDALKSLAFINLLVRDVIPVILAKQAAIYLGLKNIQLVTKTHTFLNTFPIPLPVKSVTRLTVSLF